MELIMTDAFNVQRALGDLNARVSRLESDTKQQTLILTELRDMMVSAKSSWKVMLGLAGVAATVSGLIVKFGAFLLPVLPK